MMLPYELYYLQWYKGYRSLQTLQGAEIRETVLAIPGRNHENKSIRNPHHSALI
jgi:hypothetical protein